MFPWARQEVVVLMESLSRACPPGVSLPRPRWRAHQLEVSGPPAVTALLPPVEAPCPRALTAANGETDDPEDEQQDCCDPKEVHRKSEPKEQKYQQKREQDQH